MARSRAYHWGEDGLAGISDDKQLLCFCLALWNGKDPILKERAFGLTNSEGNHGEDLKEYYFYLDSTPTHSYMKYLYKYPQAAFPYDDLIETNQAAQSQRHGIRAAGYGNLQRRPLLRCVRGIRQAGPRGLADPDQRGESGARGRRRSGLPTLWFRNTWTWWPDTPKPSLKQVRARKELRPLRHLTPSLVNGICIAREMSLLLFTENETNNQRIFGTPNVSPYVKDGINNYVVAGKKDAVNPRKTGTKSAAQYRLNVGAGKTATIRLRLSDIAPAAIGDPFRALAEPCSPPDEADDFYRDITPAHVSEDEARVLRQAMAGMLWSKQYFFFDLDKWLSSTAMIR